MSMPEWTNPGNSTFLRHPWVFPWQASSYHVLYQVKTVKHDNLRCLHCAMLNLVQAWIRYTDFKITAMETVHRVDSSKTMTTYWENEQQKQERRTRKQIAGSDQKRRHIPCAKRAPRDSNKRFGLTKNKLCNVFREVTWHTASFEARKKRLISVTCLDDDQTFFEWSSSMAAIASTCCLRSVWILLSSLLAISAICANFEN